MNNKIKTILPLLVLFIVLFSTVVYAKQYVIEHEDEVYDIQKYKARSMYDVDMAQQFSVIQSQLDDIRGRVDAIGKDNKKSYDYYDYRYSGDDYYYGNRRMPSKCRKYYERYLDGDYDWDEYVDKMEDSSTCRRYLFDDRYDGRHNRHPWGYDYDDYDGYDPDYNWDACRIDPLDYADNWDYGDYLDDVWWYGRCKRKWWTYHTEYYDDFEDRFENHDTSYNPYIDSLHELNFEYRDVYGSAAYSLWKDHCLDTASIDGSWSDWCLERKHFMS